MAALVLVVSGIVAIAGAGNYSSKMKDFFDDAEKESDGVKMDASTCNAGCALSVVGGVFAFLTGVERPRQKPGRRRG